MSSTPNVDATITWMVENPTVKRIKVEHINANRTLQLGAEEFISHYTGDDTYLKNLQVAAGKRQNKLTLNEAVGALNRLRASILPEVPTQQAAAA